MRRRIAIVDDHPAILVGLRAALAVTPGVEVAGTFTSGEEFLDALGGLSFDVLVLDLTLGRMNGAAVLRRVRACRPDVAVVIYSMHPQLQIRGMPADAVVSKTADIEDLLGTLARVRTHQDAVEACAPAVVLAPREIEVLSLLSAGQTPGDVAATLGVAPSTVSTHLRRVRDKAGIESMPSLLRWWQEQATKHAED